MNGTSNVIIIKPLIISRQGAHICKAMDEDYFHFYIEQI